jgi:hypothetical protein
MKGDELGTASGTSVGDGTGFGCRNQSARGVHGDVGLDKVWRSTIGWHGLKGRAAVNKAVNLRVP